MDKITQEAYFRQRVLKYVEEHGVTAAANRYRLSRKTVHKWKKRYDGTLESLKDRPRTPHHFPRQQTAEEQQLVKRYAKKYRGDLLQGMKKPAHMGTGGVMAAINGRQRNSCTPWSRSGSRERTSLISVQRTQVKKFRWT